MNLVAALDLAKIGRYVRRATWPGITYIYLEGNVLMYSTLGIDSPWTPTHADLMYADWEETVPNR